MLVPNALGAVITGVDLGSAARHDNASAERRRRYVGGIVAGVER